MPIRRTVVSSRARVELLKRAGHHLDLKGDVSQATAILRRKDGKDKTVTVTLDDVPFRRRNSTAFQRYPQQSLLSLAIHAVCDWNDEEDARKRMERILSIDRVDCVCVRCRSGDHVPLDKAEPEQVARLLMGLVRNGTGTNAEVSMTWLVGEGGRLDVTKPWGPWIEAVFVDEYIVKHRFDITPWWAEIAARRD